MNLGIVKKYSAHFLIGLFCLLIILVESHTIGDLDIFIKASSDLWNGKNIYQETYHEWYHYYYDVLFAIIMSPLRYFSLYWANVIWLTANLFFSYRIWKATCYYLPIDQLSKKQIRIFTTFTVLFIFALWLKNMHLTQMTIFILFLCLEGIYRIDKHQFILGALLIALGISIKIVPIVLIPYLLYRGYFKASLLTAILIVVLLFIPGLIIGFDFNSVLLHERWLLINPSNSAHILDVAERSFHSLTTLCSVLFIENTGETYALEYKRNILNLDLETLAIVITIVRLFFVAGTLLFLRTIPFKKSNSKLETWYELSYIFLITPLIFPHQQHYSFFFIFPAIAYLVYYHLVNKTMDFTNVLKSTSFLILITILFFLLSSDLILGVYREIYDHFKTLTYGVIALIPLLYFARPAKIKSS